jgi:hypothetical protein
MPQKSKKCRNSFLLNYKLNCFCQNLADQPKQSSFRSFHTQFCKITSNSKATFYFDNGARRTNFNVRELNDHMPIHLYASAALPYQTPRRLAQYFYAYFLVASYRNAFQGGDHTQNGVADDFRYEELDGNLNIVDCYPGFQF